MQVKLMVLDAQHSAHVMKVNLPDPAQKLHAVLMLSCQFSFPPRIWVIATCLGDKAMAHHQQPGQKQGDPADVTQLHESPQQWRCSYAGE